jgi:SEC-C motif-containing protein
MMAAAGFNRKPPPADSLESRKIDIKSSDQCVCGSNKSYANCCESHHTGVIPPTPEKTLRGRYSAYVLGVPEFIVRTSHPQSKEYQEYMIESQASSKSGIKRWSKDVVRMSKDYQYLGFEVVSTTEVDANRSIIKFRILLRESDGSLMAVEEDSVFVNESGSWLYLDGETNEPEEDVSAKMMREWPCKPENIKRYGSPVEAEDNSAPASTAAFMQTPKLRGEEVRASGGTIIWIPSMH